MSAVTEAVSVKLVGPRLLIVDDDPVVIDILRTSLHAVAGVDFEASATAARERLAVGQPDVVFVDLGLPDADGVELVADITAQFPNLPVVVLTVVTSESRILAAIRAGACGYLFKTDMLTGIVRAAHEAMEGGAPMSRAVARLLVRQTQVAKQPTAPCLETVARPLTDRELQLLQVFSEGVSYDQAAVTLAISANTVRSYVRSIYEKLAVGSKTEAVLAGMRLGLVRGPKGRG
jgi:DNA-binding NarL/FixJ family response regulator